MDQAFESIEDCMQGITGNSEFEKIQKSGILKMMGNLWLKEIDVVAGRLPWLFPAGQRRRSRRASPSPAGRIGYLPCL